MKRFTLIFAALLLGSLAAAPITSLTVHYRDGSSSTVTAPAVLAAAANAIAATQPAPVVVTPPIAPPIPSDVTLIGPTRAVKTLSAVKWSGKRKLLLDASTFDVPEETIQKTDNILIGSADPSHPATLRFPDCWPAKIAAGPDLGQPSRSGTIIVLGTFQLDSVNTIGGEDAIVFGSQPGAIIHANDITMDGGGIARLGGGNDIEFRRVASTGKPRAYFFGCFDNQINTLVFDNTGIAATIMQGGRIVGGQPQGETAFRLMHGHRATMTNLTLQAWLYDGVYPYKQLVQDRAGAASGMAGSDKAKIEALDDDSEHRWINCKLVNGTADICWMQGMAHRFARSHARPIARR